MTPSREWNAPGGVMMFRTPTYTHGHTTVEGRLLQSWPGTLHLEWSVVLGVSFWVMGLMPSEVGPAYPNTAFLPAVEGMTPDCVEDLRDTYCLDPKKYPKDRILYLLENKMFDVDSLLMDESRDSYVFEARDLPPMKTPMIYEYDHLRPTYDAPKQTYDPPRQSYDQQPPRQPTYGSQQPPRQTYRPSTGYLPPPRQNYTTTSKPYIPPAPPPPPTKLYGPPPHRPPSYSSSYRYNTPAPAYDNEGPYPRYPKVTQQTPSSYVSSQYLPPPPLPPRSPPKPQPWWRKVMRSSRRRQRRQVTSTDLCPYEEEYVMPRAALNNKGNWMYVVNLEEVSTEYTQLVQSKKCITRTCSGACNVPDGSTAVCQQQYLQKRLIALDGSGTSLGTDMFWIPSCCVCKIRPG